MNNNPASRLARARTALDGLAVGDAFGETFFVNPAIVQGFTVDRVLQPAPWSYTDDTLMALSIYDELRTRNGLLDQDALARSWARRYDNSRGYGPAMHGLLANIRMGVSWRTASRWLFDGQGSWGNGAAMRVAPLGAYFADDFDAVAREAGASAEITHAHPEGVAGAVAVAVAAAYAARLRFNDAPPPTRPAFLDAILAHVPHGLTHDNLERARDLAPGKTVALAVAALGNGSRVSAPDTVPFALFCAAERLDSYEEALWLSVSGLGDRDTTCAIAGGVVASYTGADAIPGEWRARCEPLPPWPFASGSEAIRADSET